MYGDGYLWIINERNKEIKRERKKLALKLKETNGSFGKHAVSYCST